MADVAPNWGAAYEEEMQSVANELRSARAEARYSKRTGRRCQVWVPSENRMIPVDELEDCDIRQVAQYEAEKFTQRAINKHFAKD